MRIPYNLKLARKQLGLRQKDLAYLLGHKGQHSVYRLEQGLRLPTLETALTLENILGLPARVLFDHVYLKVQQQVQQRLEASKELSSQLLTRREEIGELCTFLDIINFPSPSQQEKDRLHKHIIYLVNKSRDL
jgi:transcriptional regulator with XRE-family HTH domain